MKLNVVQGSLQEIAADAIIVNLFENTTDLGGGTTAVDRALGGAIRELIQSGDLTGKAGEVAVLYPRGAIPAQRVLVTGLGRQDGLDLEAVRRAAGAAVRRARDLGAGIIATLVHGAGEGQLSLADAAQATAEGMLLALYQYAAPRQASEPKKAVHSLTIVEPDGERLVEVEAAARMAEVIAAGVCLTRDLVNLPPNVATPTYLADVALRVAGERGLHITVGDRDWAAERGMGTFLAVGQGAGEPPKFIVLEYNAEREDLDTVVLVGKGITFDTGGISLKPHEGMGDMKSDMAGAATVLGVMQIVGQLKPALRVIGIAPATENMPDANAYRPSDVITASNGKTVEIISTDAEGRLILADALVYASRYNPKAVVDLATLTGACVVALGEGIAAGLFCTDDWLQDKLVASGSATHERLWPLPLWDDYKASIRSDVADMKNSGGRYGGVATSAVFLREFTAYPWAHLDIAGMALLEKRHESAYVPSGGSGFGVRLLVDFLRNW